MKKILLLFMMCTLLPMAGRAQTPTDDTFTVSDLTYDSDAGAYFFIVSLSGSHIYTAYNLDIFLPNGFKVMYSEENNEKNYFILSTEDEDFYPFTKVINKKTFKHSVSGNVLPGNQVRVSCIAQDNSNFKATSGTLFVVYLTIDESAFTSSFSPKPIVKLAGMNLTSIEEQNGSNVAVKYVPADFACRPFTTGIPTSRTLSVNVSAANKIGTLILPFDASLPSGLKVYTCNAIDGDLLTLTPAAGIEACTPYIVYAENGYSGNLSGTATLTDADNVTDIFADGYLMGVLTGTTVNSGYILQNQGSGPMFYDAEDVTFSLPAGRCYLTPPTSPVKAFAFNFGDTDGIEEFQGTPLPNRGGAVGEALFDLSGRKVESPARGIYIQGTRKVVVK